MIGRILSRFYTSDSDYINHVIECLKDGKYSKPTGSFSGYKIFSDTMSNRGWMLDKEIGFGISLYPKDRYRNAVFLNLREKLILIYLFKKARKDIFEGYEAACIERRYTY